jgi:hypothetical protein
MRINSTFYKSMTPLQSTLGLSAAIEFRAKPGKQKKPGAVTQDSNNLEKKATRSLKHLIA